MSEKPEPLSTPDRDTVRCSCGRRWYDRTREEAERIGFEHDDSPFHKHVVSSLLFVESRRLRKGGTA